MDGVSITVRDGFTPGAALRPGLFLDRDGVIVEEVNYLSRPEDTRVQDGVAGLIAKMSRRGLPVAVVTNQAGIDRGLFDWEAFDRVQAEMTRQLTAQGARLDGVAASPFHPDFTAGYGPDHAHWRKPGPAMILALAERLGIDVGRSWIVGDRASDLESGWRAGLAGGVHVLTGHGSDDNERQKALALATRSFTVLLARDMTEAAGLLTARLGIEIGGQAGPEPTRYGDWERNGRCTDF